MTPNPTLTAVPGVFARDGLDAETPLDDRVLEAWYRAHSRRRELTREELDPLVADLARRPRLWEPYVHHSSDERHYVRLAHDRHAEVWLICWSERQDTGFHDHAGSRGAVAVVSGTLSETLLGVRGRHPRVKRPAGTRFSFGATHIHDVQHAGAGPATSLHAYSPPLAEMGFYDIAADGTLRRRAGGYREEFC